MLPAGWREQARVSGAFQRARYLQDPEQVLRLLLFHASNAGGLRDTVAQAAAAGLQSMSDVALLKRMRSSVPWLRWIAAELCRPFRERPRPPELFRLRAIDSTTIEGPANTSSEWRLHYTLDLDTLACDWHELTTVKVGEALERAPVSPGDVLLGDRNYLRAQGVLTAELAGGFVLLRMRWQHPTLLNAAGKVTSALSLVRGLRVGQVGCWNVELLCEGFAIPARVVALKLPRPLAQQAIARLQRQARKKQRTVDQRSIEAARYVMLFTTIPEAQLDGEAVADLYRFRWQIEVAFKRLKQLLRIGRLPHQDVRAAEAWILSKLIAALLLESLYRRAIAISPWGYRFEEIAREAA
jgi:hypothetical protein